MNHWIKVISKDDLPQNDCFVAYIDKKEYQNVGMNYANLCGYLGHLSWSNDKSHVTVIDDGEIIHPHEIEMILEIPSPLENKDK